MILSPPIVIISLYTLANLYALISGLINNKIEIEMLQFYLKPTSLILSFSLQLLVVSSIWKCFKFFKRNTSQKIYLGNKFGWLLLFIQISYILFNSYYGVNVAGSGASINGGSLLSYIYILLQPDLLFLICGLLLISQRLYWANTFIFLLSMIMRGWMGGIFLVLIQLICKTYPLNLTKRTLLNLAATVTILILSLPFIIEAKWGIRAGDTSTATVVKNVFDFGYANYLELSLDYITGRFQHIGHVALLFENSTKLKNIYEAGGFLPYWLDGLPQLLALKITGIDTPKLNTYMVSEYFGIPNPTWNSNPGLAGWLFILREDFAKFIIYIALILLIPFKIAARYGGARLLNLIFCFSIIYLYHGWIGAYFNMALWLILVVFFSKIKFN